ncbi:MAG: hypothetical protein L3K13_01815 [Thermoplasmata archaeon]|nr:hypothetical protein [Thermoplasmata archaeon]
MHPATGALPDHLVQKIQRVLDANPDVPWCMHRLYEDIVTPELIGGRDSLLELTERAANLLVKEGRAQFEAVSTLAIGVHCQDSVYWSIQSGKRRLEEFGPEYESPRVLRRLASHMQCHGL